MTRRPRRSRWNVAWKLNAAFVGVTFHKPSGLWLARVRVGNPGRVVFEAYFTDPIKAARARDQTVTRLGVCSKLNFPETEA